MLGRFDEQITCAKEALRAERSLPGSYRQILARYHIGLGYALKGDRFAASTATSELANTPIEAAIAWVQQARHLFLADMLWLTGKKKASLRVAKAGVSGKFARPLATGFTGVHSRWLARVEPDTPGSKAYFRKLLANCESFDVIDRVEIGLAFELLSGAETCVEGRRLADQARGLLGSLPVAVSHFFELLGMTPSVKKKRQILEKLE
jgi:hypothetical protein